MNIVLFDEHELADGLAADDPRIVHVRSVLRIADGDSFDAGVIGGDCGKATLSVGGDTHVHVAFESTMPSPELYPVDVVVGFSRPQTCRFVLRALCALGVRSIEFVPTQRGERSYRTSKLWTSGEAQQITRSSVAQAFSTHLPAVRWDRTFAEALHASPGARICLDNYEAAGDLHSTLPQAGPVTLFIGSERGWSANERTSLIEQGVTLASMGPRVLRVETAAVAAVSVVLARHHWPVAGTTPSTRPG